MNSLCHTSFHFHICQAASPSHDQLSLWAGDLCCRLQGPSISNLPTWDRGHLKSYKGAPLQFIFTLRLKCDIFIVSEESSCCRTSFPWERHCLVWLCQVLWGFWRLPPRHSIQLHTSQGANIMSNKSRWHLLGNQCHPNGGLLHTEASSMQQWLFLGIIHTATYGHRPNVQHWSLGKRGHQQAQLEKILENIPAVAVLSPLVGDFWRWLCPKGRNWGKKRK